MENINQELKLTTILFRTFQHVQEVIKKDILSYGLNFAEFGTLEVLFHKESMSIQNIGEKMLMANSSMTYVMDKLESKGYILKIQDENDRRQTRVSLSDIGRNYFTEIFTKHKETLKNIYDILQADEVENLSQMLKKLGYHAKAIGGSK